MTIYYNGSIVTPSLEVPHDIYDNVEQSTSSIVLSETNTVYVVKPTSATTLTFNSTNLRFTETKYVTFMLVLDRYIFIQLRLQLLRAISKEGKAIAPAGRAFSRHSFAITAHVA